MNEPKQFSSNEVDQLVRAYLAQRTAEIDPAAAIGRFRSTVRASTAPASLPPVVRTPTRRNIARWTLATAASIAVAGGLFLEWPSGSGQAYASAEKLLCDVQQVLNNHVDLCYLLEGFRSETPSPDKSVSSDRKPAQVPFVTNKLWVRGDCFLVRPLSIDQQWAYGRDQQGRMWFLAGRHAAIQFDIDELPPALVENSVYSQDVIGIPIRKLLAEFLSDFTIRFPEDLPRSTDSGTVIVRVDAKHADVHEQLRGATLEIDTRTKLIRRLTLDRQRSESQVSSYVLTILDGGALTDADYRPESHLEKPFQVYTKDNHPERRAELIERARIPALKGRAPTKSVSLEVPSTSK
ncbi:MAG: hypothetical protein SGI77_12355 [Pirellulaceae bacterium]|nr:hypothetical protein [Pirellulaceae bacterium]